MFGMVLLRLRKLLENPSRFRFRGPGTSHPLYKTFQKLPAATRDLLALRFLETYLPKALWSPGPGNISTIVTSGGADDRHPA